MQRTLYQIAVLLTAFGVSVLAGAQQPAQQPAPQQPAQQIRTPRQMPIPQNPDFSKLQAQTIKIQGNIYLIAGAGANITLQVGNDGLLLVDTGYEKMSDKVMAAVRKVSDKPIRTIINTTLADDHTGANAPFVKAGFLNQAGPGLGGRPNEGDLIAHANLLRLMTEIGEAKISTDRWPPSTYPGKSKDFYFNDEPVILMGITALMGAANRGSDDIIEWLVSKGAKLDVKDKEGRTALTWAEGVFLATHPGKAKPSSVALLKKLMATPSAAK